MRLTDAKGGKQADMSEEMLNIMARSKIEKDYGTFRQIMNSRTELMNPTGAQGGGRTGYERANAKYNGSKRYGVRLRYTLGRLLAYVQGLQSNRFEMTCRLWESDMMVHQ